MQKQLGIWRYEMTKIRNNEKLNYEILQVLYDLNTKEDGDLHWVTTNTIKMKLKAYQPLDIEDSLGYLHDCERVLCKSEDNTTKKDTLKYAITTQGISFIEE